MNQTRRVSLYEALFGTAIGFCISLAMGIWIFPKFGFPATLGQNLAITLIFTVTSVARSYFVRRFFATYIHALSQRLAGEAK